ncbi:MAG: hypothetical protein ACPG9L_05845, partial [Crocinitomicaceae bacterium]
YRVQLVNNCLEPTKWEFVLDSEDYSDFDKRLKSTNYLNQRRILAHSWFNVPMDFYKKLMKYYNPKLDLDLIDLSYDELSTISENTKINFNLLRNNLVLFCQIKAMTIVTYWTRSFLLRDFRIEDFTQRKIKIHFMYNG